MTGTRRFLHDLLKPERLTAVVDIGANPIDGEPPYQPMLKHDLCQVTGFEPQEEALQVLLQNKGPRETYLPYAVGDGKQHTIYHCAISGMTSLYKPEPRYLSAFNEFDTLGQVISTDSIPTRRLDDIAEVGDLDMLKIDTQGSELAVFESGRDKLGRAVVIQTEVSFLPLYENQPLFWEVDRELRQQGFVPHAFADVKRWPISPYSHPENKFRPVNQLLEADVVYVKDFINAQELDDEQLKHLALITHYCYSSHDLVTRCLSILSSRSVIPQSAPGDYTSHIFPSQEVSGDTYLKDYSFTFEI